MMQQPTPIIVQVGQQQPVESTTVADVLIGAIGLTGLLVIIAVLLGGALGAILIRMKQLRGRKAADGDPDSDIIHIF